ncbi:MAG: hypothetical protein ACJ746_32190 [Bryobacteraceae bacterium]
MSTGWTSRRFCRAGPYPTGRCSGITRITATKAEFRAERSDKGEWKLIEFYEDGRLELFNLREDLGERSNLAVKESGRAKRLHDLLADWRVSVNASMPKPNPQYDAKRADQHLAGTERPTQPA